MSDKYAISNKLPGKQVSILAHRKRRIQQDKAVVNQRRKQRLQRHRKLKRGFVKAEALIMEHIKAERLQKRTKQMIIRKNILKTEGSNDQLLLVVRHAGRKIADQTVNQIFHSLRLRSVNQAVFLKNTRENQILLKVVEPFVIYGYPTNATTRDLVFKRGFAKIDNKKTIINSNTMIEEQLGEHGIICLEDIIHEIFTVGPKFDIVTQFLSPFFLQSPRDGWKRSVSISFERGGEYGNRREAINKFIPRCV